MRSNLAASAISASALDGSLLGRTVKSSSTLRALLARLAALGSVVCVAFFRSPSWRPLGHGRCQPRPSRRSRQGRVFPALLSRCGTATGRSGAPRGRESGLPGLPRASSMAAAGLVILAPGRAGSSRATRSSGCSEVHGARSGRVISRWPRCRCAACRRATARADGPRHGASRRASATSVAPWSARELCYAGTVTGATGNAAWPVEALLSRGRGTGRSRW